MQHLIDEILLSVHSWWNKLKELYSNAGVFQEDLNSIRVQQECWVVISIFDSNYIRCRIRHVMWSPVKNACKCKIAGHVISKMRICTENHSKLQGVLVLIFREVIFMRNKTCIGMPKRQFVCITKYNSLWHTLTGKSVEETLCWLTNISSSVGTKYKCMQLLYKYALTKILPHYFQVPILSEFCISFPSQSSLLQLQVMEMFLPFLLKIVYVFVSQPTTNPCDRSMIRDLKVEQLPRSVGWVTSHHSCSWGELFCWIYLVFTSRS